MSDDGSCLGSYETNAERSLDIVPQSLDRTKQMLQLRFMLDAWFGEGFEYPNYNAPDFDFEEDGINSDVTGVLLLDNLGNVVAEAEVREGSPSWVEIPIKDGIEITAMADQAAALDAEAAEEARWDNFCSAGNCRRAADRIRRQISIAQHAGRLAA